MSSGLITLAVTSFNVSQSTMSCLIKDLKARISFALFIKFERCTRPTQDGQKIYQVVYTKLMCINRLNDLANTLKSSSGGTLSLEVIRLPATIKFQVR